jgi:hypothetical protein
MLSFIDYLARYPQEAAFGDEEPAVVFDRYHAPGFTLHNDGLALDRDRIVAHIRPVRRKTVAADVDIHQALALGDEVAARYTLTARMRNGTVVATDIHVIGRVADDGRMLRLDQLTRTVEGDR